MIMITLSAIARSRCSAKSRFIMSRTFNSTPFKSNSIRHFVVWKMEGQ